MLNIIHLQNILHLIYGLKLYFLQIFIFKITSFFPLFSFSFLPLFLFLFYCFICSANRKIHQELINQRELDLVYIKTLQEILTANGIDIPPPPQYEEEKERLLPSPLKHMKDGSFESVNDTITRVGKFVELMEIDVHFRDLSFWGNFIIYIS